MRRLCLPLLTAFLSTCATLTPTPTSTATCADVCFNMQSLNCPGAQPTAAGASCEAVCTNFQKGPAPWDLLCRSAAKSCAVMNGCESKR